MMEAGNLIASSKRYLLAYIEAYGQKPSSRTSREHEVWTPPPLGMLKINFDWAVHKRNNGVGVGAIARDERGNCIGWSSNFCPGILEPEIAEALASRAELAGTLGAKEAIL
ncbi:hypothetical protein Salat_2524000 [Sesamum alatum]|uniref:RNase H type-1 domain-containing protein n=1 Tax=Sesamum alatum TaxID=300844 RepID=A0AAE1XRY7_9LAMI|nr:hypothetical protein Salat_2524000 [Sesamum alatum]